MGGEISTEAILAKVGDVDKIYVRVDQNKAYWVKGDESGALSKDSREVRERAVEDVRGEGTDAGGGKAPAICPFIARSKEERIEAVKRAMERRGRDAEHSPSEGKTRRQGI